MWWPQILGQGPRDSLQMATHPTLGDSPAFHLPVGLGCPEDKVELEKRSPHGRAGTGRQQTACIAALDPEVGGVYVPRLGGGRMPTVTVSSDLFTSYRCLRCSCSMLGAGNIAENKTDKVPCPRGADIVQASPVVSKRPAKK